LARRGQELFARRQPAIDRLTSGQGHLVGLETGSRYVDDGPDGAGHPDAAPDHDLTRRGWVGRRVNPDPGFGSQAAAGPGNGQVDRGRDGVGEPEHVERAVVGYDGVATS